MSQEPVPVEYVSSAPQSSVDQGHLRALAICHYVLGGLEIALGCFFILYVVLGLMMASGALPMGPATTQSPASASRSQPPPAAVGYVMAAGGGCALLCAWATGILTIISGRGIATHRRRVFSLVIAGINCASVPLGTVLGVFTFIVLARPSVRGLYAQSQATNPA